MHYFDSSHCMRHLHDIEAIDYFFTQKMISEMQITDTENTCLWHCLLALHWALRQGHSCLPLAQVATKHFWYDQENEQNGYHFPKLTEINEHLQVLLLKSHKIPVVFENANLYVQRYWQFEVAVANNFLKRQTRDPLSEEEKNKLKPLFAQLFPQTSTTRIDWQQVAVANAPGRKLSIISGGPGTGKTYTAMRLLTVLQVLNDGQLKIKMAAPTGKAAQRLSESIGHAKIECLDHKIPENILNTIPEKAFTLHRLLGYRPNQLQCQYNEENQLACDCLLIDEVSMIDLPMMARVLSALPDCAILLLLGDAEQLPSVEVGSILSDICCTPHPGYDKQSQQLIAELSNQPVPENSKSTYSHLTLLNYSYRFDGDISRLAKEVIDSDAEKSWQRLQKNEKTIDDQWITSQSLLFFRETLFGAWLEHVITEYFIKISRAASLSNAFSVLAKFRLLAPTRVGERGVIQLNHKIEQKLKKINPRIRPGFHYPGRPIMVTQNSYSTGLFNGDIGILWPDENGKLRAWFEQKADIQAPHLSISLARLPNVESVYAMTIHKTQGSEFEHVAIVFPQQESILLSPELLYTGLTRARKQLTIIGNETLWKIALKTRLRRYSGLKQRLEDRL